MYRVLLIDDEKLLLHMRAEFLLEKDCAADMAQCGAEALAMLAEHRYDAVLLDVKMPGVSGFDLCGDIAALTDAPIIFLSSMSETDCQLQGFESGGMDYITKDCPLELFWARLRTRMEYYRQTTTPSIRNFPPLTLDLHKHLAILNGITLQLTSTEFQLLELLSSSPKVIWTVESIYRKQWGDHGAVDKQLVQVHLSHLRRKMQKAFPRHDFLETVWGKGYQFVPTEGSVSV